MRAILAIAAAHFRQEWKVALLSLGAGLIVLGLFAFSRLSASVLEVIGHACGIGVPSATAVLMGLNLLGPDLRERRTSFYLSRPCSPVALWSGRFLGAMGVVGLSHIGGIMSLAPFVGPRSSVVILGTLLVFLLLVTNAATCILASPSWGALLFDLTAACAIVATTYWSLARVLAVLGHPGRTFLVGSGVVVAAAFALLPAGLAYLWGGKGRPRWGHRWFSWTFWPMVGLSVLGIDVWRIHEERTPLPEILRFGTRGGAFDDKRILLTVWENYPRSFVVNVETGAFERVKASTDVVRSRNGEFAAWIQYDMPGYLPPKLEFILSVARTASMNAPLRTVNARGSLKDLSDDGERALFWRDHGLDVKDTRSAELMGRVPMPDGAFVPSARFVDNQTLEAVIWEESVFRRATFALDGTVLQEERMARPRGARLLEHAPTGRSAVIERTQTVLYDRDGKPLGTFVGSNRSGLFTRDGTLLLSSSPLFSRDGSSIIQRVGTPSSTLPVNGRLVDLVGELSTGEIVVGSYDRHKRTTLLVDLQTLTVRATFEGVAPFRAMREYNGQAGASAHDTVLRVFQNDDGDLLYLDPGATKLRLLIKSTRKDF